MFEDSSLQSAWKRHERPDIEDQGEKSKRYRRQEPEHVSKRHERPDIEDQGEKAKRYRRQKPEHGDQAAKQLFFTPPNRAKSDMVNSLERAPKEIKTKKKRKDKNKNRNRNKYRNKNRNKKKNKNKTKRRATSLLADQSMDDLHQPMQRGQVEEHRVTNQSAGEMIIVDQSHVTFTTRLLEFSLGLCSYAVDMAMKNSFSKVITDHPEDALKKCIAALREFDKMQSLLEPDLNVVDPSQKFSRARQQLLQGLNVSPEKMGEYAAYFENSRFEIMLDRVDNTKSEYFKNSDIKLCHQRLIVNLMALMPTNILSADNVQTVLGNHEEVPEIHPFVANILFAPLELCEVWTSHRTQLAETFNRLRKIYKRNNQAAPSSSAPLSTTHSGLPIIPTGCLSKQTASKLRRANERRVIGNLRSMSSSSTAISKQERDRIVRESANQWAASKGCKARNLCIQRKNDKIELTPESFRRIRNWTSQEIFDPENEITKWAKKELVDCQAFRPDHPKVHYGATISSQGMTFIPRRVFICLPDCRRWLTAIAHNMRHFNHSDFKNGIKNLVENPILAWSKFVGIGIQLKLLSFDDCFRPHGLICFMAKERAWQQIWNFLEKVSLKYLRRPISARTIIHYGSRLMKIMDNIGSILDAQESSYVATYYETIRKQYEGARQAANAHQVQVATRRASDDGIRILPYNIVKNVLKVGVKLALRCIVKISALRPEEGSVLNPVTQRDTDFHVHLANTLGTPENEDDFAHVSNFELLQGLVILCLTFAAPTMRQTFIRFATLSDFKKKPSEEDDGGDLGTQFVPNISAEPNGEGVLYGRNYGLDMKHMLSKRGPVTQIFKSGKLQKQFTAYRYDIMNVLGMYFKFTGSGNTTEDYKEYLFFNLKSAAREGDRSFLSAEKYLDIFRKAVEHPKIWEALKVWEWVPNVHPDDPPDGKLISFQKLRRALLSGAARLWMQGNGPYSHIQGKKQFLEALAFDANTSIEMLLKTYLTIAIADKTNQDPRLYANGDKDDKDEESLSEEESGEDSSEESEEEIEESDESDEGRIAADSEESEEDY